MEEKFQLGEVYNMPNVMSVLKEKLALNSYDEAWERIKTLDGKIVKTLEKEVRLRIDEEGIWYDGQEEDGYSFSDYAVLYPDDFEMYATNYPYHPNITYADLFSLCESRSTCVGATYIPAMLLRKMGYNLGQSFLSKVSLFYGIVYELLK